MAESRTAKVIILSSGQALTAFVGLLSTAILTRILTKDDFGSYRQAMLAFTFAAPIVTLGLDRALYAFLPGETERPRGLLVENLILLTIAGGALSLFIIFGGNYLLAQRFNNPKLAELISLLVLYPIFMLPSYAMPACLMSRNKTGQLAIFNVFSRIVMFLMIIVPCFFLPRPSTAIRGQVTGAILTTILAVYLMFRACPGRAWQPKWSGFKKQLFFSVPLGLSTIVGIATLSLDQMMVSMRCTPDILAVYSVGAMEIPLIGVITGSITSVVIVDYTCFYRKGDLRSIVQLIHKAMLKSAILILPVMTFLFCIAPELMRILFGKAYEWSSLPFRIYLLLLPIRTLGFGAVLQATENSHHILINSLLGLTANAILGWTFIGIWGPSGAAIGAVFGTWAIGLPYAVIVLTKILKIKAIDLLPLGEIVKILIISVVPATIVFILKGFITISDVYWIPISLFIYIPTISIGFLLLNVININELNDMFRLITQRTIY